MSTTANVETMKVEAAEILAEMKRGNRTRAAYRFELLRAIDEATPKAAPVAPSKPPRRTVLGAIYVRGGV